ncbi:MAG: hypothetical protein AB1925_04730 [Actinomycetota bacterium]
MRNRGNNFPEAPRPAGAHLLDARLHLLDRQLLDADGEPVGIIDDLEIDDDAREDPHENPQVTAILTGQVLFTRVFGGQPPRSQLAALPWRSVAKIDTSIHLRRGAELADRLWVERWLCSNIIGRIPGGRHATQ